MPPTPRRAAAPRAVISSGSTTWPAPATNAASSAGRPDEGAAYAPHASLAIFPVADPAARVERLRREILDWRPDWVLVSSEDLSHALLREAHHSAPGRVVYLAHTPQFFPFGPESWNPDPAAAALVAQSAGIVAIGHHMAGYIEHSLNRRPTVIHPPIYGARPVARLRELR